MQISKRSIEITDNLVRSWDVGDTGTLQDWPYTTRQRGLAEWLALLRVAGFEYQGLDRTKVQKWQAVKEYCKLYQL